mgnify:CR=1 FL=1
MSRYNVSLMMETYTDDFGNEYSNIPVKIQKDAPEITTIYQARVNGLCAPAKFFKPRHLIATFTDGRKLKYPIDSEDSVVATAIVLKAEGAVCIDYVGERWNFILGATVGGALEYRSEAYANLVASKDFETGSFAYTSALTIPGITTVRLPYRVPANDNADLKECQEKGLVGPEAATGICAAGGIIVPRFFTIRATADDGGKVARKAKVSLKTSLKTTAIDIAGCAQCLSYNCLLYTSPSPRD